LKSRSGIKVGDRVRLDSPEYDDIPGTVTSIEWPHFKARWDGGGGDSVPFPIKYAVVISSAPGLETVFSEIRAGRVINAIKEYRAVYGVGLKEAKDSVEAIREAMNLAAPAPVSAPRDSIVVRFENGKYEPNSPPKVHPSLAEATAEAERLAKKEPGIAFATFSLMSHSTATKPTVSTVAK
jgi:hypothetical protein